MIIKDSLEAMDFDFIYDYLSKSYWSEGISRSRMKRAMQNSINIGLFVAEAGKDKQVAYARIVTDRATYAYLCDVFVTPSEQKRGYSKKMMEYILAHPDLQGIKRFNLATLDAHGLYRQFGWTELGQPEMHMEINRSGIYKTLTET